MFERPHHQKVLEVLRKMDRNFLDTTKCYFGGGTAISLLLGEYRESVDIDFLCADQDGYRRIRSSVFNNSLGDIFSNEVKILREVRQDRDGVRAVLSVDGTPIKFEIVREARIELEGMNVPDMPVPFLSKSDLFAEKLLANADRFADKSVMSRDVIDLMVMESKWGQIPREAWGKANSAYGESARGALAKAMELLRNNPDYFDNCLSTMGVHDDVAQALRQTIKLSRHKSPGRGR